MSDIKLLVIPGSARAGSLNRQLAAAAAAMASAAGASVATLDLRSLQLPLYDGDIEAASGVPEGALRLQDAINAADALLVVTPEYNGFPTPLVINAFDWLSRIPAQSGPQGQRLSGLTATTNKPLALLSASPGLLGGLRSMNYLRQYFQMAFAMIVVPQQFALSKANEAFDEAGALKDERAARSVQAALTALATLTTALRGG